MSHSSRDLSKSVSKGVSQIPSKDESDEQTQDQGNAGTSWQHRAEMALAAAKQAGRTITYAELADAAEIPNPQRIHKLTAWLETTMRKDHADGKPLRAALVISRNRSGLPAPGFFMLCGELGLYDGSGSGESAVHFHRTSINDLWRKLDP